MKCTTATVAFSVFSAVSLAAPYDQKSNGKAPDNVPYLLQAMRTGEPFMAQSLEARDLTIKIGGEPSTSCPDNVQKCPKLPETAFNVDNETKTASMAASVPGGQQLYVTKEGKLSYTQAHSASVPEGAHTKGFELFDWKGNIEAPQQITFKGAGATRFFACKDGDEKDYTVYANVKGFKKDEHQECSDFDAARTPFQPDKESQFPAWQYN